MPRFLRLATYDNLLTLLLFLIIVVTCGLTPMQTDTWWQLRAGRDMWQSGTVLLSDIYSHTAQGSFWLNHEWLADVLFFGLYRIGGLPLLTLFAAGLIAGGWAFTWRLTHGPVKTAFLWTALALVCSAGWWEPRPHAFSLLFLPLTVFLMARGREWWLPAVFLVWANTHGGVLLGFVLIGAGLGVRTLMAPASWWRHGLVAAACVVAVTLTPLGLLFWTEIPRSLMRINQYTLDEWMRPGISELAMSPFWLIAAAFVALLVRNRRRLAHLTPAEATVHACACALLPGALMAVRNVGPFVMVAVPAITWLLAAGRAPQPATRTDRRAFNLAVAAAALIAVAWTLGWAYTSTPDRLRWTPLPPTALAALEQCPDNLYNRYDEGGPLLWFAPDRKVFLDGRQDPFPPELVLEHIEMETGRRDYGPVFARHGIQCAFLPVVSPVAGRLSEDGWVVLYKDPLWTVLRKPGPV